MDLPPSSQTRSHGRLSPVVQPDTGQPPPPSPPPLPPDLSSSLVNSLNQALVQAETPPSPISSNNAAPAQVSPLQAPATSVFPQAVSEAPQDGVTPFNEFQEGIPVSASDSEDEGEEEAPLPTRQRASDSDLRGPSSTLTAMEIDSAPVIGHRLVVDASQDGSGSIPLHLNIQQAMETGQQPLDNSRCKDTLRNDSHTSLADGVENNLTMMGQMSTSGTSTSPLVQNSLHSSSLFPSNQDTPSLDPNPITKYKAGPTLPETSNTSTNPQFPSNDKEFPPLPTTAPKSTPTAKENPNPKNYPPPKSFASTLRSNAKDPLKSAAKTPILPIETPLPSSRNGVPAIFFKEDEVQAANKVLSMSVILKFRGGNPSLHRIKEVIAGWGIKGDYSIGILDPRHTLLYLTTEEDMKMTLAKETYKIDGVLFRKFRWTPDFDTKAESSVQPVWVQLHNLPLPFFVEPLLSGIASTIGGFLKTDSPTVHLLRPKYARFCSPWM